MVVAERHHVVNDLTGEDERVVFQREPNHYSQTWDRIGLWAVGAPIMFRDIARSVRDQLRRARLEATRIRYAMPGSPNKSMSTEDARIFEPVLEAWRPRDGVPTVLLRWFMTEWCNYQCPYCDQTHGRNVAKGGRFTAHAFDNFPVDAWTAALDRHFGGRGLSVVITGGEPFVDRKAMPVLLKHLTEMPGLACLRIDTNAWWKAKDYRAIDKSKIVLMCTLHPSQTSPEAFFSRIDALIGEGFRIGMVNYVMNTDNISQYNKYKRILTDKGIPLHPNPLWQNTNRYAREDLDLLHAELPEADFAFRSGAASPKGMKCLFPSLAYEMDYKGNIHVGCHEFAMGSLFHGELPGLFSGPVPCPHDGCVCLDKYSFLGTINRNTGLDPLATYGQILRTARSIIASGGEMPAASSYPAQLFGQSRPARPGGTAEPVRTELVQISTRDSKEENTGTLTP
jgi:organic radical activating enzyme